MAPNFSPQPSKITQVHTGRCTHTARSGVTLKAVTFVTAAWPGDRRWQIYGVPDLLDFGIPELKELKFQDLRLPRFCHLGDGQES